MDIDDLKAGLTILAIVALSVFLGASITRSVYTTEIDSFNDAKLECEKNLPRSQFCKVVVTAIPEQLEKK